jgi:hypothetical protein
MLGPAPTIELTASGAVKATPGHVLSVVLTGGSDAASVILYDAASATGTKLVTLKVAAGASVVYCPPRSIPFGTACYAGITGTSPAIYVQYE